MTYEWFLLPFLVFGCVQYIVLMQIVNTMRKDYSEILKAKANASAFNKDDFQVVLMIVLGLSTGDVVLHSRLRRLIVRERVLLFLTFGSFYLFLLGYQGLYS